MKCTHPKLHHSKIHNCASNYTDTLHSSTFHDCKICFHFVRVSMCILIELHSEHLLFQCFQMMNSLRVDLGVIGIK